MTQEVLARWRKTQTHWAPQPTHHAGSISAPQHLSSARMLRAATTRPHTHPLMGAPVTLRDVSELSRGRRSGRDSMRHKLQPGPAPKAPGVGYKCDLAQGCRAHDSRLLHVPALRCCACHAPPPPPCAPACASQLLHTTHPAHACMRHTTRLATAGADALKCAAAGRRTRATAAPPSSLPQAARAAGCSCCGHHFAAPHAWPGGRVVLLWRLLIGRCRRDVLSRSVACRLCGQMHAPIV